MAQTTCRRRLSEGGLTAKLAPKALLESAAICNKPMPHEKTGQVGLAAYATLRDEIKTRSAFQHAFTLFDITAVGAIGSFALQDQKHEQFIIVLALLCPTLGLLWLDHAHGIAKVSTAITEVVRPAIEEEGFPAGALAHEEATARTAFRSPLAKILLGTPTLCLFGVPAGLALWIGQGSLPAVWWAGALVTVVFVASWLLWLVEWFVGGPRLQYPTRDHRDGRLPNRADKTSVHMKRP
jgi:hypothetical protein